MGWKRASRLVKVSGLRMFVEGGEETQGFVGFGQQTISSIAFYHYRLYTYDTYMLFSV